MECVDPEAEDTAEKAEERVFQLKILVSKRLKDIEETRSVSGRSSHSERFRSSGKSKISRKSALSLRPACSVPSTSSKYSISNQTRIAALKAKADRHADTDALRPKVEAEAERARAAARARLERRLRS